MVLCVRLGTSRYQSILVPSFVILYEANMDTSGKCYLVFWRSLSIAKIRLRNLFWCLVQMGKSIYVPLLPT